MGRPGLNRRQLITGPDGAAVAAGFGFTAPGSRASDLGTAGSGFLLHLAEESFTTGLAGP
ncbi:hypothetical protein [Streptomyces sp. OR43]|uniref:hypothetical protein n=1 Tax=Streptomyces sp. or43 TaxID=2478957 RepID=UPI0011CE9091|nr:hypothetical protein [Streptomyces sp. or43]TXS42393.1 hypothetical protein EAO72_12825 [Streptomyces sp. or43]